MSDGMTNIAVLIRQEVDAPVSPVIQAIAEAARRRHGHAVLAVLFYGSGVRGGGDVDNVTDLYLLVESYGACYRNPFLRLANAVLPPNVYYLETAIEGRVARAKYGVLSLPHFERLVAPRTLQPYFWARFAQPTRLVWARDEAVRRRVNEALAQAVATTVQETLPLFTDSPAPQTLFQRAFRESYRTELRAERQERACELYTSFARRYDRLAEVLLSEPPGRNKVSTGHSGRAAGRWRRRRLAGKLLSVLRLMKGAFTFKDGAGYLLWKIERHSGVRQTLTPWQRRHPVLASTVLFWRLYRKGAFH